MRFNRPLLISAVCVALAVPFATGCASRPEIRLDKNPSFNVGHYQTFGFYEPMSTDKSLYTTIISGRLKNAARQELESRNYVYDQTNPDLRVNFALTVVDRQEVRSTPHAGPAGWRFGWADIDTVNYRQGTLALDLVDARKKELVWQGIAEGRVSRKAVENPGPAVDEVVSELFDGFPLNREGGDLVSTMAAR
jgi:hypothetical protein